MTSLQTLPFLLQMHYMYAPVCVLGLGYIPTDALSALVSRVGL